MLLTWSRTNSSSSVSHSFTNRSLVSMSIFCFFLLIDLQYFFSFFLLLIHRQGNVVSLGWCSYAMVDSTVWIVCFLAWLVERKERWKEREGEKKERRKRVTRSQGPSHHSFHSCFHHSFNASTNCFQLLVSEIQTCQKM